MTRDEIFRQLELNTHELQGLKTDPGFLGDLEVFISKTLDRYDPQIRALLPKANALLGGLGPAGAVAALVLGLTEGPALTIVEKLLDAKRKAIEETHGISESS